MKKLLMMTMVTILLLLISNNTFAQSVNYSNWEINGGDLTSGKLSMSANETKSITFSVTVVRQTTGEPDGWLPVNFQFQLQRLPSGSQSCGCTVISNVQTITSSDFASGQATVTKSYTTSVVAQSGSSLTGSALRNGDKIGLVTIGPWSPNKDYIVTVSDVPISNNSISTSGNIAFNKSGDPSIINGSTPTGGISAFTYQWQSSIASATSGFSNITGATAISYDPPVIQQTTYYKRVVNSGTATSASNVITITINQLPPISNNIITASGSTSFLTLGDPSIINGSAPTGGTGSFTYQWQLSTESSTTGFTNIPSATNISYDPPLLDRITYYKRIVTSDVEISSSNVVQVTVWRTGATFNNPIDIGNLGNCSSYESILNNDPSNGYGNEYGNPTDDIFYKFNLVAPAKITLQNCKADGISSWFYLLNETGNLVPGGTPGMPCDVGSEIDFILQPGIYYVVSEGPPNENMHSLPIYIRTRPIITSSPDVTIASGSSTILSASGGDTYRWFPATGLSSPTGPSVTASPVVTTTYTVMGTLASGCQDYKLITVTISGPIGSKINNPIIANIGGCGYTSTQMDVTGYGNDYGGPSIDIFYQFTLTNESLVDFDGYSNIPLHLVLLNSVGNFIDEQYYGWVDSGDDAGTYIFVPLDGTPLRPTLQPGTYFLVAEGTNGNGTIAVGIKTPAGYSCRESLEKNSMEKNPDEQLFENNKRVVYPNPADKYVFLSLEKDAPAFINIVNTSGVILKESEVNGKAVNLNISDLPNGLYLIKILQENKMHMEKILIER